MRPVITDLVAVHGQRPCPYTSNVHGKSTHKIKTTKQNQEKVESNQKKVEKQAKRQQERAKNRSETNKTPTQNEQKRRPKNQSELRTWSRVRTQSEKKRGVKTPQKIYASFCEMKPIVLKNPTPSFCGL